MPQRSEGPRRVVVTGVGMVTNLGLDTAATIARVRNGEHAIGPLSYDHPDIKLAGEITNFDPREQIPHVTTKSQGRIPYAGYYALKATNEALSQAGLLDDDNTIDASINNESIGVYLGTGIGGVWDDEPNNPKQAMRGPMPVTQRILRMLPDRVATSVELQYGTQGSTLIFIAACSSGSEAIGHARNRLADPNTPERIMITGGAEAAITPTIIDSFNYLGALSKNLASKSSDERYKRRLVGTSIPLDQNKSGFHMSEGAGILVLEDLAHALERGAKPLAEIIGYGSASEGDKNVTATGTSGKGLKRAMEYALSDAGITLKSGEIYGIEAHATGTDGDEFEVEAIHTVYQRALDNLVVHSPKQHFGHPLGASGPIQSVGAVVAINEGIYYPNRHNESIPVAFHLPKKPEAIQFEHIMVNSSGFGQVNAALLFAPFRG